jgi:hypothetical protein
VVNSSVNPDSLGSGNLSGKSISAEDQKNTFIPKPSADIQINSLDKSSIGKQDPAQHLNSSDFDANASSQQSNDKIDLASIIKSNSDALVSDDAHSVTGAGSQSSSFIEIAGTRYEVAAANAQESLAHSSIDHTSTMDSMMGNAPASAGWTNVIDSASAHNDASAASSHASDLITPIVNNNMGDWIHQINSDTTQTIANSNQVISADDHSSVGLSTVGSSTVAHADDSIKVI